MGDLNSDPDKGERFEGVAPIRQLLDQPQVRDSLPTSKGGVAAHPDRPPEMAALATSHFGRLDYILPSRDLRIGESGVFWPGPGEPLADVIGDRRLSSDHRLVWVDVIVE
jgi:hypothetical protein